jgi:hypothetical protein
MQEYEQTIRKVVLSCMAGIPTIVVAIALLLHGLKFRGDDEVMGTVILWKIRFLPIA